MTMEPRTTFDLVGQDDALARAARFVRGGRLPQALLITGPRGIGKATLAYRIARYILTHGATDAGPSDLSVPVAGAVARQVSASAHPGLAVLERQPDTKGKMPAALVVDEIRKLGGFFGLTSGAGGWRVAIIDSADDMNANAANAVLKTLEEPPARSLLILIAHAPGRLLPTIRSRCQRLDLRPLDDGTLSSALARARPDLDDADRAMLAQLSEGSLGLALQLAQEDGDLARDAQRFLGASMTMSEILGLAEKVAREAGGPPRFGAFLSQAIANHVRARAASGEGAGLDRGIEIWERVNALYARAERVYLDPRQTVLTSALAVRTLNR